MVARDGQGAARTDRPLPAAGRPDGRGARARWTATSPSELAVVATVESAGAAMVYRISEASIRRALDAGQHRGRPARVLREALENTCAARLDVPDRRCGPPARAAAGRHGDVVRAVRGPRPAGAGDGRARPPSTLELRLLAPTVAVSQAPIADVLAALRDARFRPGRRGLHRRDRRPPGSRRPGAAPRSTAGSFRPLPAPPTARPWPRGRRGAAQAWPAAPVRRSRRGPGARDDAAAAGRAGAGLGGDRLHRRRRGGHPAGGVARSASAAAN